MKLVRIIIADDHAIVRQGLRRLVEGHPGWEVCAETENGRQTLEQVQLLKPDVLVLDVSMPELNGLEVARRIHRELPQIAIVVLTMHETEDLAREVLTAGALAYILKTDASRDLISAIEAACEGRTFSKGGSLRKTGGQSKVLIDSLTTREREVLQLLAEGRSNKEVAVRLRISVKTVETHRTNLMRKLDVHSISEIIHYAVRNRIIHP